MNGRKRNARKAQIWGKYHNSNYDGDCKTGDFHFGNLKILGRWILVDQRVHCQLYLNSRVLSDTDTNTQPYIWSKEAA
jgi:hypothetical protein